LNLSQPWATTSAWKKEGISFRHASPGNFCFAIEFIDYFEMYQLVNLSDDHIGDSYGVHCYEIVEEAGVKDSMKTDGIKTG
jgi:hypothetical protein